MRKFIAIVAILCAALTTYSQEYKVVEVPGATKDELFKRAVYWLSQNFKSANNVIQLKDKEEGQIIVKGSSAYNAPAFNPGTNYTGHFSFTLTVDCKDNKYRYLINRVEHTAYVAGFSAGVIDGDKKPRRYKKVVEAANRDIEEFSAMFESGMKEDAKSEDW